jgi:hypothetical protein
MRACTPDGGVSEVYVTHIGAKEQRIGEISPIKNCVAQVGMTQVGALKRGVECKRARDVCPGKIGACAVGDGEISSRQGGAREIGSAQTRADNGGGREIGRSKCSVFQLRLNQIG